jgi:hypothetical protein
MQRKHFVPRRNWTNRDKSAIRLRFLKLYDRVHYSVNYYIELENKMSTAALIRENIH